MQKANYLGLKIWRICLFYIGCFSCLCLLPDFSQAQIGHASAIKMQTAAGAVPPIFRLDQFGYVADQPKGAVVVLSHNESTSGRVNPVYNARAAIDSFEVFQVDALAAFGKDQIKGVIAGVTVLRGRMPTSVVIGQWFKDRSFYPLDLQAITTPGSYQIRVFGEKQSYLSPVFKIVARADFVRTGVAALLHYFRKQRANTPVEWAQDVHLKLKGSKKTVDLRGGWCDASGDVSKYFSHLAYTNLMSPQQIPLATWSLIQATEKMQVNLKLWGLMDSIRAESLWGADYLLRSLSDSNYFYMTVFSYFKQDPSYREIVGLEANSVTTTDYACAMREGAGMAIAALARISTWNRNGSFTSNQYLKGAERAYQHLLHYNKRYDDDGVPNIIDDYCGLMAAAELWNATGKSFYKTESRIWATHLCARYMPAGYLRADGMVLDNGDIQDKGKAPRPFWHASDAGLPIISLLRYLELEKTEGKRAKVVLVIVKLLKSQMAMNAAVPNPFNYPRQQILYKGQRQTGFFIPHDNESGWWWQGENARLASLSTAALLGERLLKTKGRTNGKGKTGNDKAFYKGLSASAMQQLSWITGCNPYGICFLYGFGGNNVPYMHSNYGHGSEWGGISNGITGLYADGTGIAFRTEDNGNEWRWTEQWLPHAAWYLQALTALSTQH